jgi:predicted amidohydrolase
MPLRIALASLDQRWLDKDANYSRCETLAAEARATGAALVVFPELTLTGFSMDAVAEPPTASPSIARFAALATRQSISIVFGVALVAQGRAENTLVCVSATGEEIARYAKIHPFSYAGEDRHFASGDRLAFARIADCTMGFSICYDLRFPELFGALAADCDVLLNIANWPASRSSHWTTLLRARAIDNQAFVVGVNRTGTDGNGLSYDRNSMIVGPAGDICQPVHSSGELDVFDIDAAEVHVWRARFPVRRDRRPQLYSQLA